MMNDSSEEDCTIYIEELKSDDPNLKINAVSKISSIAKILGPTRTCSELLPYLIEIIEEQDNEDEFLIKLSQEILSLKKHIGGNTKAHLLIGPLEILSSMEEPLVREKAVEVLSQLAEVPNEVFFENHFFQVVQQLGQWDNYPSRISASSLLPTAYPYVSVEKQQILWDLFKQLCGDDTPMVRRQCAGVIAQLAQLNCITLRDQQQGLLQLWNKLLKDPIDSVKVKAIEGSQFMLKLINDKNELEEHIQCFFGLADAKEKSWRVRYTVPETLPSILNIITKINKDKSILKNLGAPVYLALLKDIEPEVRSISVQTLHSLLGELPNSSKEQFIVYFSQLAADTSPHVRLSFAEQFCKIAAQFQMNAIITSFVPLAAQLFKDEIVEIKIKLAHNLPQLSGVIGQENSKKHLMPLIQQFYTEKQWRFKLEVMTVIPKLIKVAGMDSFQEIWESYLEKGVMNHYQAIRDQAIDNFTQFREIFGYDAIKVYIKTSIDKLYQSTNYIYRVTSMHALNKVKDVIPKEELQVLFRDLSTKGMNDPVPNVRLNVFKLYSAISTRLDQKTQNDFKMRAKKLENDGDIDVAYFASNYMDLKQ